MTERYFGDVLGSYANGLQLDLRVKLAVDFLKSMGNAIDGSIGPAEMAGYALNLATELITESERRGLIASLPDHDELSAPMRRHIRRQVRAQIFSQVVAQEIGPEEQPKIAVGAAGNPLLRQ
jgi:hypothetical protein